MNFIDENRVQAREWAQAVLQDNGVVILDTETTGLHGEAVEIAVIDLAGNVLMNRRVKPVGEMETGAERIHGISMKALENEPAFVDVYNELVAATYDKRVLIYNYAFDSRILRNQCKQASLKDVTDHWHIASDCVMEWYAQWYGEWNDYHGSYKWQRLSGGDHSALGDCLATLEALKRMAGVADE
jgi:DNA polymerase III subunit epsilon